MPKPFQALRAVRLLSFAVLFTAAFAGPRARAQSADRPAIVKVAPVYPALARQMHILGKVKVVATVDPSGKVIKAESDSQVLILVPAAVEAVKQWKFKPADVTSTITIFVDFAAA